MYDAYQRGNKDIVVYPNQFIEEVTLILENSDEEILIIKDILGNEVYQNFAKDKVVLNTSNWSKGVYFVFIKKNKNSFKTIVKH